MTDVQFSFNKFPANVDPVFSFTKSEPDYSDSDEAEINVNQWLKLDSVYLEQSNWNSYGDSLSDLSPELSFEPNENNNCVDGSLDDSDSYSEDSCFHIRSGSTNSNSFAPFAPTSAVNSTQLPPLHHSSSHGPSCTTCPAPQFDAPSSSYVMVPYCPYSCCAPASAPCCPTQYSTVGTTNYNNHQASMPFSAPPAAKVSYAQAASPTRSRSPSPLQMYSTYTHVTSMLPSTINLVPRGFAPKSMVEEKEAAKMRTSSTGHQLISNSSTPPTSHHLNETGPVRRVRQTRPKVVEAKGAKQCKGRNRKKGIQCRNAALMEYIGPRPEYCAEHIDLDPRSLYTKCKSTYQKEVGDNKGCKEVVLKEFGVCYKHYLDAVNEMIRNKEMDTLRHHLSRIGELLNQLEREAAAAKKKDGDLYQRKNKLIPKFQEMKKLAARAIEALQNSNGTTETSLLVSIPTIPSPSSSSHSSPNSSPVYSFNGSSSPSFNLSFKEEADATPEDLSSEEFSPVTHTFLLHPEVGHEHESFPSSSSSLPCDFLV